MGESLLTHTQDIPFYLVDTINQFLATEDFQNRWMYSRQNWHIDRTSVADLFLIGTQVKTRFLG